MVDQNPYIRFDPALVCVLPRRTYTLFHGPSAINCGGIELYASHATAYNSCIDPFG